MNSIKIVKTRIKLAKLDCKVQIHPWQREREGDGREERIEEVVDELAAGVAHLRGHSMGQVYEIFERSDRYNSNSF